VLRIVSESELVKRLIAGLGYVVDFREMRVATTAPDNTKTLLHGDAPRRAADSVAGSHPRGSEITSGTGWQTGAVAHSCGMHRLVYPRAEYLRSQKPLAVNTLKRIARGIQRFVIDSASPFIVKCNHTTTRGKYDCFRGRHWTIRYRRLRKPMAMQLRYRI
jgi:DNA (cytosine-5)-methyltransferase 1